MATKGLENIIFNAKRLITVPSGHEDNHLLAATALKNLSDLGFILDEHGVNLLSSASKEDITTWYGETQKQLEAIIGGDHEYHPFYPNFPQEVIEKTSYELFCDQLKHYWTGAIDDAFGLEGEYQWTPEGTTPKVKSLEEHPLKVLETIDKNDEEKIKSEARKVFQSTLRSKNNLSARDLENIVNEYMKNVPNWTSDVTACENRRTLSYLYATALVHGLQTDKMPSLVTNDYLRIAALVPEIKKGASATEITELNKKDKFKIGSLPRSTRKFIANGINEQKNLEEDIARNKQAWKALFQKVHIGEFTSCERANDVANKIRNNIPLDTFYSRIERAFVQGRYSDAVKMYQSRPGEFIKNFNRMLNVPIEDPAQKLAYATQLIDASKSVFSRTRPEDLVNFISYLKARTREDYMPIHNVKGKMYIANQKYAQIPQSTANTFIKLAEEGIKAQVKTGQSMGKVYIDPVMEKMALPKATTETESLQSYTKGSRIPMEQEDGKPKSVRFLLWFDDPKGNGSNKWDNITDISAAFFMKGKGGHLLHCDGQDLAWYQGRKNMFPGCYFSGDYIGTPDGGATEFIDLDVNALRGAGVAYVMLYVNIYEGAETLSLSKTNFGWQERNDLNQKDVEQMSLSAVKQHCILSGDAKGIVPAILDVESGEMIWTDQLNHKARYQDSMRSVIPNIEAYIDMYGKGDRVDMKRAAELLVEANGGTIVDNPKEADTLFMVSPYEEKTEEQVVHTATDQSYWLGAIAPQVSQEEAPEQKTQEQTQSPLDIEEMSIADIIANYDGVVAQQNQEQMQTQAQDQPGQEQKIEIDEEDLFI